MNNYAYICVLIGETFYPGLCALNYSLKKVGAKYPLRVAVPKSESDKLKPLIKQLGLDMLILPDLELPTNILTLNPSARWNKTFFKLQIFNLVQYDKIVFLDLDMLIFKNIDELFEKPHFSAVAAGNCLCKNWQRLNSGLMVIEPNEVLYNQLISCIPNAWEERKRLNKGFGDQDVINYYLTDWWKQKQLHLPEIYNCLTIDFKGICKILGYKNLKVIHFAEYQKPWDYTTKQKIRHIIGCLKRGDFARLKMCIKYWKCLRKSKV